VQEILTLSRLTESTVPTQHLWKDDRLEFARLVLSDIVHAYMNLVACQESSLLEFASGTC
jgi:hypothetical protein